MDGIAHGPDGGERVVRAARQHRILAELPELEAVELRFGPGGYVAAPNVGFAQRLRDA